MGVWRIWHPTYEVIHDEVEVIKRGTYASTCNALVPEERVELQKSARRTLCAKEGDFKKVVDLLVQLTNSSIYKHRILIFRKGEAAEGEVIEP